MKTIQTNLVEHCLILENYLFIIVNLIKTLQKIVGVKNSAKKGGAIRNYNNKKK